MKYIDVVTGLQNELHDLKKREQDIKSAIDSIQKVCKHDYVITDSTPHFEIEICKNCAHERRN